MNVLVTGISGLGRSALFEGLGPEVNLFDVGQEMEQIARERGLPYSERTILRANPVTLGALRAAAVERIVSQLNLARNARRLNLVSVHSIFMLRDGFREGLRAADVKAIAPSFIVTLIDGPQQVHDRLREHPGEYFHLSVESIVRWQEFEAFFSGHLAQQFHARHYVAPVNQRETFRALLMDRGKKVVYASYPMTHLPPEDLPLIRRFVDLLNAHFTVFDPASIEGSHNLRSYYTSADLRSIASHTVVRDLDWFIGVNADAVVAYWPTVVFSSGMNDELRYAYESGKETILVTERPKDRALPNLSPFTTYKSKLFWSSEDFAAYLRLSPELQEVYAWIQEEIVDVIRLQKETGTPTTKEMFKETCAAVCRYNLPEGRFEELRVQVEGLADGIYGAWTPLMASMEKGG